MWVAVARASRRPASSERQHHVFQRSEVAQQLEALEHKTDLL